MFDNIVRDLQILHKTDVLIGRVWLGVMARRFSLFAFAGLIAVFGLGMANVAGFYALQTSVGSVWAAAIVAIVDFVIAAVVLLVASNARPGAEMDLAFEVRKMAIQSLQADTQDIKLAIESIGQEIRDAKASIIGLVHNPLDAAAQKLLIPAVLSIVRGLRSKK